MAYNLESLVQILEEILHPPDRGQPSWHWVPGPQRKPQIESLLEKARFLKELFENCSPVTRDEVQSLENRIRDAAHEAEDVIESHKADLLLSRKEGRKVMIFPPDLQKVIGEFDAVKEEMTKIMEGTQIRGSTSSLPISSRVDPNPKNIVVGLEEDLIQLKDRLTRQHCKSFEIIPIVGMGGIGKTTLARKLYDDPLLVSHFDRRAWTTISQVYDVRDILLTLLQCIKGNSRVEKCLKKIDELALELYQTLCDRRYLIVLDDMWSSKAWDDIKVFFPNNNNGSRILVTSREVSVANYAGSRNSHHPMNFLSEVESWNLLHSKLFVEETCPQELENFGKKIAKDCRGLPLAIHVVGGLLSGLERTTEAWEQVAEDVSSVVASKEEQISNVLYLSYRHLPNHLRPCFLYMGAFPEDYEIQASNLIRLWLAEGFLKPITGKSLEEAAKLYLKALVDRNLLMVHRQETKGNVKSYKMHDLLRDLCARKAYEENFLLVLTSAIQNFPLRRLSAHAVGQFRSITTSSELTRVVRSVLFPGRLSLDSFEISRLRLRLLRVLDILRIGPQWHLEHILKLVNLRYLALYSNLSSSISPLCNLQTLIVRGLFHEVHEIFDMPRLRHIKFQGKCPRLNLPLGENVVLQDLQTLCTVEIDNNFPKILEAIPNLMKLGISGEYSDQNPIRLYLTRQSKTFKCRSVWSSELGFPIPPSLRELTISGCKIPSGYMNKIATFPYLEVLKLKHSYLEGKRWEPTGEFCRLRILLLQDLNLEKWIADKTHYPRLERLVIRNCYALEEIPSGIGEISSLGIIEVDEDSRLSAVASARKIQEENDALQVHINAVLTSHFDEDAHGKSVVLQDVETLSTIEVGSTFPKILEAVPNLKKLGISGRLFDSNPSGIDLTCLSKLETLKCQCFRGLRPSPLYFLVFPSSLKKLNLYRCAISAGCMNKIGILPNLQVLKLRYSELEDRMWKPSQGEFRQLRLLLLEGLDLQKWIADETHYPRLERLFIQDCKFLEEIPSDIGEFPTLQIIEVDEGNSSSAAASAREIRKEHIKRGIVPPEVHIVVRINHFEEHWEESSNDIGLQDIETLFPVHIDDSFAKILAAIPNLKKSGISERFSYSTSSSLDLTCLSKLETLKCQSISNSSALSSLVFPPSLKKLTLYFCGISHACMNKIGTLPNLQVLKLRFTEFEDGTWEPIEGEFCRLRFLLLEHVNNLEKWIADETHYPILERLVIRDCKFLEEIPAYVGDIPTLQIIELHGNTLRPSLVDSARKIQEEQLQLGNDDLQVIISCD